MARKRKDKRIEKEYWEEMEITDPVTGEIKKHKVKITRYKAVPAYKPVGNKGVIEELEDEEYEYVEAEESED
jgi:hypothetical protein